MSNLDRLQQQALVASNVLNTINPLFQHFNHKNHVIFGNYNQHTFETHSKTKKHFGYQSILEAIARVNGHNTYKSLLTSTSNELAPHSLIDALLSLNPYPLSPLQTAAWYRIINNVVVNISTGLHPQTFNFKKHAEASYLNLISTGMYGPYFIDQAHENFEKQRRGEKGNQNTTDLSLEIMATSIYLTAIKQPLTPMHGDTYPSIIFNANLERSTITGYTSTALPFKDHLNSPNWPQKGFKTFRAKLAEVYNQLFDAKLIFSETDKDPLDHMVHTHLTRLDDRLSIGEIIQLMSDRKSYLEKLQSAALDLKANKSISDDQTLYTHPLFNLPNNPDCYTNTELNQFIVQAMKTNNPERYGLWGTKLFWINIAPCILLKPELKILSSVESAKIKEIIQIRILNDLVPIQNRQLNTAHEYHYKLKISSKSDSRYTQETHFIPKRITILSDYALSNEVALLMVHAEILKLSGSIQKFYGDPNSVICFSNMDQDLTPSDLLNSETFENLVFDNLLIVDIVRMKKAKQSSYIAHFKPEAIVDRISVDTYDNNMDEIDHIDPSKPFLISMRLMDTLYGMGMYHRDDCVDEILVGVSLNNFNEYQFELHSRADDIVNLHNRNTVKQVRAEINLLKEPFLAKLLGKFINTLKEVLPKLKQQRLIMGEDPRKILSEISTHPFDFYYTSNHDTEDLSKLEIEID